MENTVFLKVVEAFKSNDMNRVKICSNHFLELVKDIDTLLSSHEGFLLGPWLESAKHLARDTELQVGTFNNKIHVKPSVFGFSVPIFYASADAGTATVKNHLCLPVLQCHIG